MNCERSCFIKVNVEMSVDFSLPKSMADDKCASPLASVEEIQRRLVRPASPHSPPQISTASDLNINRGSYSSQSVATSIEFRRRQEAEERETSDNKLEDYLDPSLLSAISSKINRARKTMEKKAIDSVEDFEWAVDHFKVLSEFSEAEKNQTRHENDSTAAIDVDEGNESRTMFGNFEQIAFKLSKS